MAEPQRLVPISGTVLQPRADTRVVGRVNPDERAEITVRLRPRPSRPWA